MSEHIYWYRARLSRLIDGDTVELLVDNGMHIHSTQRVRLLDVYAPERNQAGGSECRDEADKWLTDTAGPWPFLIETVKDRRTFDRYVADVYRANDGEHLNEHMRTFIAAGGWGGGTGASV